MNPGSRIGPYEIIGWVGAGGMGEVYRARDARLGREVAIKLIGEAFAMDASRVHRFEQEARAAGQLNHPNIVVVYDTGVHEGAPYIVSELLEGESLRSRLKSGAVPPLKAIDYARQTAEGLAAAHHKGIVHRDVKPDNLFISRDGRIKILDFGIAKLATPGDGTAGHTGFPTETAEGTIVGTIGYMSPEQVRGEAVDARSDIFSVGTVLHEMLTGRPPFTRGTAADSMAAILKDDPAQLPGDVPAALARIVSRCLEKTREARFQSARDLAFALDVLSGTQATAAPSRTPAAPRRWRHAAVAAVVVLILFMAVASWLTWTRASPSIENPLANAQSTLLTNWEGTEEAAEISPDGKFVAFLADRDGEFDLWLHPVGTTEFYNLTRDLPALSGSGSIVRKLGFSGDGTSIWFNPADGQPLMRMPFLGGTPHAFLRQGANTPAWSPDGTRLVYVYKLNRDDPMFVADRNGAEASQILPPGVRKINNPVWSPDSQWIYFASGAEPQDEVDINVWRVRPSGEALEQLTAQHAAVKFVASLTPRTLLYVARDEDWSGPWLWALDVESRKARRVTSSVDQYTSVSASRDGKRVVATVANPSSSLWRVPVPLLDRVADERDAQPYPLPGPTGRALAPRFGLASLFYLSTRGTGDGLWKVQDGRQSEVWRNADGALFEPPAVSPDGTRVTVVFRHEGKRHLSIMSADGTNARTLAASIEIEGAAGQGTADWSPDGKWIVTGGRDAKGPALFLIPVDGGGAPVRLREGTWFNPVWSPKDDLIVYAGRSVMGQVALSAVRQDGSPVELPTLQVRPGGYRFLPNGKGLVYLPRIHSPDFWLLDFASRTTRQITRLGRQGNLVTFDITRDGKAIVFDRSRQNSNIVLIDLPK